MYKTMYLYFIKIHLLSINPFLMIFFSARSLDIEESMSIVELEVERSQGSLGQVTVDMATQAGTALAYQDLNKVEIALLQDIPSRGVSSWHSFMWKNTVFVVMLNAGRVGELTTTVGSPGAVGAVNPDDLFTSTIFRWAGELVPIQVIK